MEEEATILRALEMLGCTDGPTFVSGALMRISDADRERMRKNFTRVYGEAETEDKITLGFVAGWFLIDDPHRPALRQVA